MDRLICSFIHSKPMMAQMYVSSGWPSSSSTVSPCRWAWGRAEEDLHQMGELSPGPGDLSHRRPVHGPARRPHADPPPGGPLRGTAGQYGSTDTHTHTARPQRDPLPHAAGEGGIMCLSSIVSVFYFCSGARSYQNARVKFHKTQQRYALWKQTSTIRDDNLSPTVLHFYQKRTCSYKNTQAPQGLQTVWLIVQQHYICKVLC